MLLKSTQELMIHIDGVSEIIFNSESEAPPRARAKFEGSTERRRFFTSRGEETGNEITSTKEGVVVTMLLLLL